MTVNPRVPPPLSTRASAEKWRTVNSALGSWSKTAQFCVMVLVMNFCACGVVLVALAWLARR